MGVGTAGDYTARIIRNHEASELYDLAVWIKTRERVSLPQAFDFLFADLEELMQEEEEDRD